MNLEAKARYRARTAAIWDIREAILQLEDASLRADWPLVADLGRSIARQAELLESDKTLSLTVDPQPSLRSWGWRPEPKPKPSLEEEEDFGGMAQQEGD